MGPLSLRFELSTTAPCSETHNKRFSAPPNGLMQTLGRIGRDFWKHRVRLLGRQSERPCHRIASRQNPPIIIAHQNPQQTATPPHRRIRRTASTDLFLEQRAAGKIVDHHSHGFGGSAQRGAASQSVEAKSRRRCGQIVPDKSSKSRSLCRQLEKMHRDCWTL
jgi:hypothetical protein